MSLIFRRGISSLVPPKVASPSGIGASGDAKRMQRLVQFYERLPRGPAPEPSGSGPIAWYRKRYFGKNASAARTSTSILIHHWDLEKGTDMEATQR
ncbi:MAG: hypothetical protein Q9162_005070 [Coniocarpon cinnabarinum]